MTELDSTAYAAFETELHEVERTLAATADELGGPLGELVRGQVMRARPSVRAALVLSVAATEHATTEHAATGEAASGPPRRQARMDLAAALEMLYIALNIHRLLVDAVSGGSRATPDASTHGSATHGSSADDEQLDRAFVGSTILAGDYCFSRAAQLAARTDDPAVVALFAQALQTISESQLRRQFAPSGDLGAGRVYTEESDSDQGYPDDTLELLQSGAQAAAVLAGMDAAERNQALQLAHEVAAQLVSGALLPTNLAQPVDGGLQMRRQILLRWLAAQVTNGRRHN